MIVGLSQNDCGTPVSVHVCESCGNSFTVCPPTGDNWGGCQAEGCSSYDVKRDIDRLFDESPWRIKREGLEKPRNKNR